ncbi:hypothetical protein ACFS07_26635 [Undibacterium arcticum]
MIPLLLVSFLAAPVFAQSTATEVKRDVNQQQRIENGLKSGQLNTREAAKLEHEETRVDRAQANALKDGKFSVTEKGTDRTDAKTRSATISTPTGPTPRPAIRIRPRASGCRPTCSAM